MEILSEGGIPLIWELPNLPPRGPVITVECYCKWYCLYIVRPDMSVKRLEFHELDLLDCNGDPIPYICDHAPSPQAVNLYASRNGMHVDSVADELIAGRWAYEHDNLYPELDPGVQP